MGTEDGSTQRINERGDYDRGIDLSKLTNRLNVFRDSLSGDIKIRHYEAREVLLSFL